MIIRDYTMYTYTVSYVYRAHVRDELGETTGEMKDVSTGFFVKVVARSRAMADAWVQERHNAEYQSHKDFTLTLIEESEAPHLLIEFTG